MAAERPPGHPLVSGAVRDRVPARRSLAEREALVARVMFLHARHHSVREIASRLAIGRETVRRIIRQEAARTHEHRAERRIEILAALAAAGERISIAQASIKLLRRELLRLDEIALELDRDRLLGLI